MEAEIKKENRGGARPGSGRKRMADEDKKKYKHLTITLEAFAALEGIKNKNQYVSDLILEAARKRQ